MNRKALLQARRDLLLKARGDLISFARLMEPDPDHPEDATRSLYEATPFHRAAADILMKVEQGQERRVIFIWPPRHGKTQLASKLFPAWFVGRKQRRNVIFTTYSTEYAWDIGREVRDYMRSRDYGIVFNVHLDDDEQGAGRLRVSRGGLLLFVGRGGSITGRGGDLLVIDDPLKDAAEAASPLIRDKLWVWYKRVVRTRLMTDQGAIVIITTRWNEDDLVGRLTDPKNPHYDRKEAKRWTIIEFPALARDEDPILQRQKGAALWPDRFSQDYLGDLRAADPEGFHALYQGRPAPEEGVMFKAEHIRLYHARDLPKELRIYGASDHAVSSDPKADRTCMLLAGMDQDHNLYVLPEVVWERLPTNLAVERMVDLMDRYKPLLWWMENGPITRALLPFLRRRMLERSTFVPIDEVTVAQALKDKRSKVQSILGRMSMGKVLFPGYASWWPDAKHELLAFPNATHDEIPDVMGLFGMGLMKAVQADKKTPAPRQALPGTWGALKQQWKRERIVTQISKDASGW